MGLKKILFILFALSALCTQAQYRGKVRNLPNYDKKKLHFGFTLGGNNLYFSMRHSDIFVKEDLRGNPIDLTIQAVESQPSPGFHLGGLANFRLNQYFDFRTLFVLSFSQRNLVYTLEGSGIGETDEEIVKIESIYTQFPLLLKLKSERVNNYRPYLIAGINPYLDLAAGGEEEPPFVNLKRFDVFYEAGFGVDFYLQYFKFAMELKYSFGTMDMLQKEGQEHAETIGSLYSHMFTVSFNFE